MTESAISAPLPVLALRGIHKQFGGIAVLDDVQLGCAPGEVHALMGQNGAGKSTLIKVLTGVLPSSGGEMLPRRAGDPSGLAARCAEARDQHGLPGGEPVPEPVGGREHVRGPLSAPRRAAGLSHRLARR